MRFETEREVREFVRRFKECEMPLEEFSHAAHVVVGTVFVYDSAEGALGRMCDGLLTFTAHHGKAGVYKEDVTRDWIARLSKYVTERSGSDIVELVNGAVVEFATAYREG